MRSIANTDFTTHFAVHKNIVPKSNLSSILPFLLKIPVELTDLWGYEVRLGSDNAICDFQFCVNKHQAKKFYTCLTSGSLSVYKWEQFSNLIHWWSIEKDKSSTLIQNIWIEMDRNEMEKELPIPNFFFAPSRYLPTDELLNLLKKVFSFLGKKISEKTVLFFSLCHESLPENGWISQVGMMLARNDDSLRLFIQDISKNDLITYLNRLGWSFSDKLFVIFDELYNYVDFINLDIDITNQIGDGIGLECYFKYLSGEKLNRLLEFFLLNEWITTANCKMLLNYFDQLQSASPGLYQEFFHHFKLKFNPNGPNEVKFYPGIHKDVHYANLLLKQIL